MIKKIVLVLFFLFFIFIAKETEAQSCGLGSVNWTCQRYTCKWSNPLQTHYCDPYILTSGTATCSTSYPGSGGLCLYLSPNQSCSADVNDCYGNLDCASQSTTSSYKSCEAGGGGGGVTCGNDNTNYGQGSACTSAGGTCQNDCKSSCSGGTYQSGLCPGPSYWKCCVPNCTATGNSCTSDSQCCSGNCVSGVCRNCANKGESCSIPSLYCCGDEDTTCTGGTCVGNCREQGELCGTDYNGTGNSFCCDSTSLVCNNFGTYDGKKRCHQPAGTDPTPTPGPVVATPTPSSSTCVPVGGKCTPGSLPPCCGGICALNPVTGIGYSCQSVNPTVPPPTVGPSPTPPLPAGTPWIKIRDGSFSDVASLNNSIPTTVQPFGEDDPGHRFFIDNDDERSDNEPGAITASSIDPSNMPTSSKGWKSTGSSSAFSSQLAPSLFYEYVKSRKEYVDKTEEGINNLDTSKVNIYEGNLTIDTSAHFNNKNVVLVVNGNVTLNPTAGYFRPNNGYAMIVATGNLTFGGTITEAEGIFVATNIYTGTATKGLKITGNLIAKGSLTNNRSQPDSDNQKPSVFIVFDPSYYLNLLPLLSTSTYDWRQLQ